MRWVTSVYNPYVCRTAYRREQIVRELVHSHIIGIPGTCTSQDAVGIPVSQTQVGTHLWIEWGRRAGRAEQAAGVAIALRRNVFHDRNVRQVYQPPEELAGRFGAVRLVRGDVDLCAIVVYQYPEPHPPNTDAQRRQAKRLWMYVAAFLDRLPHRCLPVLLLDANGHTGLHRHEGGFAHINSEAVGQADAALENFNGSEFRQLLELHHLAAINSFHPCGPTYYGTTGRGTRVDYICLPQTRLHNVSRCYIQKARAYRLQWHACAGLRDHVPLTVVFEHGLHYQSRKHDFHRQLDRDSLAQDALQGVRRPQFLADVEIACEQALQKLELPVLQRPTVVFQALHDALAQATKLHYSGGAKTKCDRPADTREALFHTQAAKTCLVQTVLPAASRDSLQFLANLLQQWKRLAAFWRARRASDVLVKRDRESWRQARVAELNYFWHKRDFKGCYRVSRLLSGFRLGPKRRRFDRPKSVQPTCSDWLSYLQQDGPDGGCQAKSIDWEDVFQKACQPRTLVRALDAAKDLAWHDFHGICQRGRRLQLRKGYPSWGMPAEVWRQVLFPTWKFSQVRFGIGYADRCSLPNGHFQKLFHQLLLSIRSYDEVPVQWQRSEVIELDKHNGKAKCAGVRAINNLDTMGKLYFGWLGGRCKQQHLRHYAAGYICNKSRLDAMLVQNATAWRAKKHGLSVLTSSHDVANAFYSPLRSVLHDCVERVAQPVDASLLQQRHSEAYMCVKACDGNINVQPQTGILQGDGFACEHFLLAYHPAIDEYCADMLTAVGEEFVSVDPVSQERVDCSLSSYADDVCKKHVVSNPDDMAFRSGLSNCLFDAALSKVGIAQNADKQVHHVLFCGQGSDDFMRAAYSQALVAGGMHRTIKYLGGISQYAGGNGPEITARVRAAQGAWCSYGKLWSSPKVAARPLVTIFKSSVYSHVVSGLEARVLHKGEYDRLDRFVLSKGRKVMRGDACAKILSEDGQIAYHAVPSHKVWRFLQLVPSSIELRVRRLKLWQAVARCPHKHVQLLAAVFGRFSFETLPTLDCHGRLAHGCNPWAVQFQQDIQALGEVDDGVRLVQDLAGSCVRMFTDLREQFMAVDCTVLRRQFLCVAIPPPGFQDTIHPTVPDVLLEADLQFACDCKLDDGSICSAKFASRHALAVHKFFTKNGTHGQNSVAYQAAVSNVCPWCRCIFVDKRCAKQHIQRSFKHGRCKGKGCTTVHQIQPVDDMSCPYCQAEHDTMDGLLQCITTHVAGPTPAQAAAQDAVPPQ